MQTISTGQTSQHKHIFFSGTKGIKTKLINDAKIKIAGNRFELTKKADEYITQLIKDKTRLLNWIDDQPEERRKSLKKIIISLRNDAIRHILTEGRANKSQLIALSITEADLLFEEAFLTELVTYSLSQLDDNPIFKAGLVQLATGGKLIDYSELNRLSDELEFYRTKEKELSEGTYIKPVYKPFRSPLTKAIIMDNSDETREEMTPEELRLKAMQENSPEILASYDLTEDECRYRIRSLLKEYRAEVYRTSEEKLIPKNLCFYLLYDPKPIDNCKTEDEAFRHRVLRLRKSNLLALVDILRKINNEYYKAEIKTEQKLIAKMNRQVKKISATEKRELIQLGKAEGMKQKEVASSIPCSIETVKRHWN